MYSLNCCRLRRGPRLRLQSKGRTSVAMNSVSAIFPISLKTFRAAIMTAGSLVFMPFSNGTIFSCTVYLSRIALLGALTAFPKVLSLPGLPPQSTTKASKPRTLIARLLVFVKTAATRGNNSFLMVEKSNTASIVGIQDSDLSTMTCVGESSPIWIMGKTSVTSQLPSCKN